MLTKSASVPTFYLHQFWHIAQVNLDDASFKVTLERQEYNIDLDVLREVLMLPVHKEYTPILTELEVLDYMIELGYDLGDARHQMTLSSFNVKFLPQPWRTFFMLIIRSISGRKSGHEHPRATHLQVFWGMMSGRQIDFADHIMSDIVFQIQSKAERTMIPFLRFTKLIINHLIGETPAFLQ